MRIAGIGIVLAGWLLTVSGLLMTSSTTGRGIFALAGIAVSLFGSLGVLNKYYLARANWKQ